MLHLTMSKSVTIGGEEPYTTIVLSSLVSAGDVCVWRGRGHGNICEEEAVGMNYRYDKQKTHSSLRAAVLAVPSVPSVTAACEA
jgi:hypothetical protein